MSGGDRRNGDAALIAALAGGATVQDAAATAGVSVATAHRRLADDAFRQRVAAARDEMVAQAVARLSAAATEAVDALRALLASEMDFARLGAARSILELGVKLREHTDHAERIAALEREFAAGRDRS